MAPVTRFFATPLVAVVVFLGFASCAGEQAPERRCVTHAQCDDGFLCGKEGLCTPSQACDNDGQCCHGAVCFSSWCRPTAECSAARGCSGLGEVCENEQCVPAACDALSACAEPFVCLAGRCLLGLPCAGRCEAGSVCDVLSDRCVERAEPCVCEKGYPVTASVSDGLSCQIGCECAALSEVPPGRPGVSGALLEGGTVLGYEPEYGDLVASRFEVPPDLLTGEGVVVDRVDTALDGLPEGGVIVAEAAYRGGRLEPGPDRGDKPVVFEDAGTVHTLYRDLDENRLRYGHLVAGAQAWEWSASPHLLPIVGRPVGGPDEPAQPDLGVGRFACLSRRPDGGLGGLVFVGADSSDTSSLLVRLESRTALPQSPDDWVATTVIETPLPPREVTPCGGACALTEACVVAPSGAHACAELVSVGGQACGCGAREVCGEVEGVRRCHPRVERRDALDRLPFGQGLFVSCVATPSGIAAAWYDADTRRLVAGRWPFSVSDRVVVDEGVGRDPGHFAAIVARGEALAIAYQDASTGELLVARQSGPGAAWGRTVVPAGPGEHGLQVHADWGDSGLTLVAGEGQTGDILVFADRGCWAVSRVLTAGSFVYPDLRVDGASAWVSARALVLDNDLHPRHAPVLARVPLPTNCP